jgi:hypothetical protein
VAEIAARGFLATCVTQNPAFVHRAVGLASGMLELEKRTNVVLAATNERLLVVATGIGGGPVLEERIRAAAPGADHGS